MLGRWKSVEHLPWIHHDPPFLLDPGSQEKPGNPLIRHSSGVTFTIHRSVYHLAGLYKMIYKIFLSHQSLAYTMVIPWLYHGYTMLYYGYTMVIPWLYHGYTMVIPWLYYDYTMVMAHFHSISHDFTVDAWVDLVDVKIAAGSSGSTVKTTSLGPTMRHWESCASAWPSSHP